MDLLPELPFYDDDVFWGVSELFKVFGDFTRVRVLHCLLGGEMTVGELAQKVGMSQSAISHQLSVLRRSQLVRCRREGKNILYAPADDHVRTILNQGLEHVCESKQEEGLPQ